MKNNITLTIGIPAYNEEANICQLIDDILAQNYEGITLKKIIVSSDASTDGTDELIKNYKDPRVILMQNNDRGGIAVRLNQIFESSSTDCLLVMNADTRIKDPHFIRKLTDPIKNSVDMTSARIEEVSGSSVLDKALIFGMDIKRKTVESVNNGVNVYTCCGLARAFSKKLYSTMRFETSIGEDAFSYFYTVINMFSYQYVKNTAVFYKISSNFNQHQKQTLRFFESQRIMKERFGEGWVTEEYSIPLKNVFHGMFWGLKSKPFFTFLYILSVLFARLSALMRAETIDQTWQIATSSKKVQI